MFISKSAFYSYDIDLYPAREHNFYQFKLNFGKISE